MSISSPFTIRSLPILELMEKDAEGYRMRIRSAIREEMIHSIRVITVKNTNDRSIDLTRQFKTAESYYEHLLW